MRTHAVSMPNTIESAKSSIMWAAERWRPGANDELVDLSINEGCFDEALAECLPALHRTKTGPNFIDAVRQIACAHVIENPRGKYRELAFFFLPVSGSAAEMYNLIFSEDGPRKLNASFAKSPLVEKSDTILIVPGFFDRQTLASIGPAKFQATLTALSKYSGLKNALDRITLEFGGQTEQGFVSHKDRADQRREGYLVLLRERKRTEIEPILNLKAFVAQKLGIDVAGRRMTAWKIAVAKAFGRISFEPLDDFSFRTAGAPLQRPEKSKG